MLLSEYEIELRAYIIVIRMLDGNKAAWSISVPSRKLLGKITHEAGRALKFGRIRRKGRVMKIDDSQIRFSDERL